MSLLTIKPMNSENRQRMDNPKVWTRFSDLMHESERLKTFVAWNVPFISKNDLAAAGFFYLKEYDLVQCFYCDGRIGDWEKGDIPLQEHRRHFPNCPMITAEDICNKQARDQETTAKYDYQISYHLNDVRATELKFAEAEERLRSFIGWPKAIPQQPRDLAAAGFYYTGISDHVRCFSCDGGLRNWEKGDDCWREHARSFGGCKFLLGKKGQAFVDEVLRSDLPKTPQYAETVQEKASKTFPKTVWHHVEELSLRDENKSGSVLINAGLVNSPPSLENKNQSSQRSSENSSPGKSPNGTNRDPVLTKPDDRSYVVDPEERTKEFGITLQGEKSAEAKDDLDSDKQQCKICMDEPLGIVFVPCGHLVACVECAPTLKLCPICRRPVGSSIRAYIA